MTKKPPHAHGSTKARAKAEADDTVVRHVPTVPLKVAEGRAPVVDPEALSAAEAAIAAVRNGEIEQTFPEESTDALVETPDIDGAGDAPPPADAPNSPSTDLPPPNPSVDGQAQN